MNTRNKGLIEIHLAVFLFGMSGVFGKLLSLPSMIIVLGRVFFSSIFLLFIILYLKKDIRLKDNKHYVYLSLMGIILAIHWSAFFLSIQLSTVTIGLLTFSTFPIFLTFLEPWFLKEKIMLSNVVIAIITFSGVMLIVPKLQLGNNITQGALWGIISGISYAILSMLNKKYVKDYSSLVISFYEQLVATIVLIPFMFFHRPILGTKDILLLFLLGVVFTGISHSLFINGLKHVKTQVAGIISSLEPVYGIILAAILLKEIPSLREVLGGVIILATALYSTIKPK